MESENEIRERLVAVELVGDKRMEHMEADIREIKATLKELTALANRGRGSFATSLWIGGFLVTAISIASTILGINFSGSK